MFHEMCDWACLYFRYLQENRVACEMGLYYVLHIAKLRNKNALQRLLPALGKYTLKRQDNPNILSVLA